ncbi:nitrate reductase subunit beta [Corynebacterium uberis]|uniref:nitrate reductase subunit beta n=1 Tax=Corynebacterium TaxID=1716 RepID=UPI001D0AB869|nr:MULTISPECIES: nitrate reductase subunit beta [Corynebacterium]MCZ9309008.1 nitrate reductase subunit beta [Corynebacterium sp. c6VSa_13]UDL74524.1 nitrate reductase subunit beta [Corynebacterium uberis]UDL76642.1 nitrate reductase subunit beta [Corynebacterium uberis]UDL78855.1 nitrate reductase subunit beta [Corynebacterium uberis]UDL81133.1 nitrate reductase subunit beta [Corynebacterium uberis]
MKVMAQIAMVMNLDKCIGCHTCSVTCKQAWTNREGTEYIWFNNVETRPGVGYPRAWEDQDHWEGGWIRTSTGKLRPRSGGRMRKLATIFHNPKLPTIDDYYEPWTYEYDKLLSAPRGQRTQPTARPVSALDGRPLEKIEWSSNWDDNLGGSTATLDDDPVLEQMNLQVSKTIEDAFMFYLPRICEHCLNPTCVSSCPSGAMYKRTEDGIVLVDQDRCRGWRMCVSGCPYKKVYFNHKTGKAEKCTLCYPRLEVGQPTVCSETCVGRLRYLGVLLYDADRVAEAAATEDPQDLYQAQRDLLLDPHDPEVIAAAIAENIPHSWIDAAQQSPIWDLIQTYQLALPLHPEYRTLPMVWYIPPLSPVVDQVTATGNDAEDHRVLLTALSTMRIPLDYLAGLFTAGDTAPVELSLRRLAAMRSYMRDINLGEAPNEDIAAAVGMTGHQLEKMYRLLAIAKYDDRFVIPTTSPETPRGIAELDPFGHGAPEMCHSGAAASEGGRVSLASWEPGTRPDSLFREV